MLSDRSLSDLSVTLVYCGQTVAWIKMKLGTKVGLGPGHIVLECRTQMSDRLATIDLGRTLGALPWLCPLLGDGGCPSPKKGGTAPNVRSRSIVAKRSLILATSEHLLFVVFYMLLSCHGSRLCS